MITSFPDDNLIYVRDIIKRDSSGSFSYIKNMEDALSDKVSGKDFLYGYTFLKNEPLTLLYNFPFYTVKFYLAGIETLHSKAQERELRALLKMLSDKMENYAPCYVNIRVPTHIVDLIKAFNEEIKNTIFCGGTVEEYSYNSLPDTEINKDLNIFFANRDYLKDEKKRETLLSLTFRSFETYQGQYHISPVTDRKAGELYKNWIEKSFHEENEDKVLVAEYKDSPIGFVTIREDASSIEGILNAVSPDFRGLGTYKGMIKTLISYGYENNKAYVSSTQLDNFIVQRTWAELGMKPFYSIYNFHKDLRR